MITTHSAGEKENWVQAISKALFELRREADNITQAGGMTSTITTTTVGGAFGCRFKATDCCCDCIRKHSLSRQSTQPTSYKKDYRYAGVDTCIGFTGSDSDIASTIAAQLPYR
jgi:hypothetical protein